MSPSSQVEEEEDIGYAEGTTESELLKWLKQLRVKTHSLSLLCDRQLTSQLITKALISSYTSVLLCTLRHEPEADSMLHFNTHTHTEQCNMKYFLFFLHRYFCGEPLLVKHCFFPLSPLYWLSQYCKWACRILHGEMPLCPQGHDRL